MSTRVGGTARALPKLFGAKGDLYGRQTSDCSRDEPAAPTQQQHQAT